MFGRPDDIPVWLAAARVEQPDWNAFLGDYHAAVDWPASAFWRELSAANPDAVVLLSSRPVDDWWTSAINTIFAAELHSGREGGPFPPHWSQELFAARFTPGWRTEADAKAAYLRHNDEVRREVAPDRLLQWRPGDGWDPICAALGLPVPDQPFPHLNSTAAFNERIASLRDAGH